MKVPASQQKVFLNLQVHTGPAGLNIPELPEDASDEEILAALASLEQAKTKLMAKGQALADDAEKLFLLNSFKLSEEQAALRSRQIKGILKESKTGITDLTGIGDL